MSATTVKNICLIIGSLTGGGAEKSVLQLATALSKLGHRVDVIILNNIIDYDIDDGINVYVVTPVPPIPPHTIRLRKHWLMARALREKISELHVNFDLCVSNVPPTDAICKMAKLPNLVFCIRSTISRDKKYSVRNNTGFNKWILKIKYSYFSKKRRYKNANLVAISHGIANDLLAIGVKPKSLQTIYNPFDADSIRSKAEAYSVTEDDYIIHVGRFVKMKRYDVLINAYKNSGIKQKLLLIGDYETPEGNNTRRLVIDLGLEDKVVFVGFKSNPYPYIRNAKVLVLSSNYEGFGRVIVEGLILGVPVVSTDCPWGPREILTDDLSQFLSPVGDIEALSENLRKVIARPPQIREHHTDKFNSVVCAKKWLALCESKPSIETC